MSHNNNNALRYTVLDDEGVIASFVVDSVHRGRGDHTVRATDARVLMGALRNLPREYFRVTAVYPRIGDDIVYFNNRRVTMDIAAHLPEPTKEQKDDQTFFVAPQPFEEPKDGVLGYFNVTSIYDITKAPDRAVLTFAPDAFDVLGVLSSNSKVFGLRLVVLQGVPGSEYTAEFDKNSWNLEKASYHALIADIKFSVEQDALVAAAQATVHDREKAQYTRADGTVKEFADFTLGSDDRLEE